MNESITYGKGYISAYWSDIQCPLLKGCPIFWAKRSAEIFWSLSADYWLKFVIWFLQHTTDHTEQYKTWTPAFPGGKRLKSLNIRNRPDNKEAKRSAIKCILLPIYGMYV